MYLIVHILENMKLLLAVLSSVLNAFRSTGGNILFCLYHYSTLCLNNTHWCNVILLVTARCWLSFSEGYCPWKNLRFIELIVPSRGRGGYSPSCPLTMSALSLSETRNQASPPLYVVDLSASQLPPLSTLPSHNFLPSARFPLG